MRLPLPVLSVAVALATSGTPAALDQGILPAQPTQFVGGGEVLLEVVVTASGTVSEIRTVRATPPYADHLRRAVKNWTFEPARSGDRVAVPSRVLVGGFYRPAVVFGSALTVSEPVREVATTSAGVPYPYATAPASYPPRAAGASQVLVAFTIAADGTFTTDVLGEAHSPFREAALDAARQWRFRSVGAAARAYVVFGFRPQP